ncbi:MAG: single-stranded DNA-binding protein [Clostridia bacterium]|nr:single-stranded DNA-binding protein [Clostridia bacterium]
MNKVYLIGNLTRDPEISETSGGVHVCRFAIAVNRTYASSDGTRETDFFNITVWRQLAENCGKYLKKGSKVAVVGQLQNRSYEDKDGVRRTVTDVIANEIEFLTPKSAGEGFEGDAAVVSRPARKEKPVLEEVDDDQLPF